MTLDQLIYFDKLDQLSRDSYLAERSWHFAGTENFYSDSASISCWIYNNPKGSQVSRLTVRESLGEKREVTYTTVLRAPFESIRQKIHTSGLELVDTGDKNGLQSYYRGAKYNLMLGLSTYNNHPVYLISIAQHGLFKGLRQHNDGTTETVWVDFSTMGPERAQQLQALGDSLNRETLRLQTEWRAQRAAASRSARRVKGSRKK